MSQVTVVQRKNTPALVRVLEDSEAKVPSGTIIKTAGGTYWRARGLHWANTHPKQADKMRGGWQYLGKPELVVDQVAEPTWDFPAPREYVRDTRGELIPVLTDDEQAERDEALNPEHVWEDADLPLQGEDGWFVARKKIFNPALVRLGDLQGPRKPRKQGEFGSRDRKKQSEFAMDWFKSRKFPSSMIVEEDNQRVRAAAIRESVKTFPLTPEELAVVPMTSKLFGRNPASAAATHWMVYSALGHDGQGGDGGFKIEALANIV